MKELNATPRCHTEALCREVDSAVPSVRLEPSKGIADAGLSGVMQDNNALRGRTLGALLCIFQWCIPCVFSINKKTAKLFPIGSDFLNRCR
ncbi:MAG: hypothetical protein WCI20_04505 [bacterium]